MKITPTLEECKKIAAEGNYGVIPISTEMYADMTTPIEVLRILKKVSGHVYLLESAEADKRWGRYSFLGYDPLLEITWYDHNKIGTDQPNGFRRCQRDHPQRHGRE